MERHLRIELIEAAPDVLISFARRRAQRLVEVVQPVVDVHARKFSSQFRCRGVGVHEHVQTRAERVVEGLERRLARGGVLGRLHGRRVTHEKNELTITKAQRDHELELALSSTLIVAMRVDDLSARPRRRKSPRRADAYPVNEERSESPKVASKPPPKTQLLVAPSRDSVFPLATLSEVPPWVVYNTSVLTGYRRWDVSFGACLRSLFQLPTRRATSGRTCSASSTSGCCCTHSSSRCRRPPTPSG